MGDLQWDTEIAAKIRTLGKAAPDVPGVQIQYREALNALERMVAAVGRRIAEQAEMKPLIPDREVNDP